MDLDFQMRKYHSLEYIARAPELQHSSESHRVAIMEVLSIESGFRSLINSTSGVSVAIRMTGMSPTTAEPFAKQSIPIQQRPVNEQVRTSFAIY